MMRLLKSYILDKEYDYRFRLAAALVVNKTIFIGFNQHKSHPIMHLYGKYINDEAINLHAEADAIRRAKSCYPNLWDDAQLYVMRVKFDDTEKSNNIQGIAKPCDICMNIISDHNISRVIYSKDNHGFEEIII